VAGVTSVFAGLAGPLSAARVPEEALERYTTGLISELPNKNGDTIAQAVPGTSAQRLQEFRTKMEWDEEA